MSYLIYTDRNNLLKSLKSGLIRIPVNLRDTQNLSLICRGDRIYFYDFENSRIYGPAQSATSEAREEKNPRQGPFNGFGNVSKHFRYLRLEIDCSSVYKKGVPASFLGIGMDEVRFRLKEEEEKCLLDRISRLNDPAVSVVVHISTSESEVNTSIVEINKGTSISQYSFPLSDTFGMILERKKRIAQTQLLARRDQEFLCTLRDIGALIYDSFFRKMDCERFFKKGGYRIDFAIGRSVETVPFEISYRNSFLFEQNIIAYRSEENRQLGSARMKRVLIIADPEQNQDAAYREGLFLFDLFSDQGVEVNLCSRNISRDMCAEFFSGYDVVHFTGRSSPQGESTAWDLGGDHFDAQDIAVFEGLPHLIFSNSCGNSPRFGMEFLRAGVQNVVCSRWKVPFGTLHSFLLQFYTQLLKGEEIGYSFNRALSSCYDKGKTFPLAFLLLGESRLIYEK